MKVIIIIPSYNEEKSIRSLIQSCKNEGFQDIVVIDDGSTDDTGKEARSAGAQVITHLINRGAGAATQTGLEIARQMDADMVVTIDADGQHDPKNISSLVNALNEKKVDLVIGSRFKNRENHIPLTRIFFNKIGNIITFLLSGVWTSDSQSGFKAFGKKALEKIDISSNGFEFCSEIFQEINQHDLKVATVPIRVEYNKDSMKKGQNFATGITTVIKLLIRSLMR